MSEYTHQVQQQAPVLWDAFVAHYGLTPLQAEQFAQYAVMLKDWNEKHNLTAITDMTSIIADHFWDSLSITKLVDFSGVTGMADVGSGGGFPGIPLKIMYPDISSVLIEINGKKVQFLHEVVAVLTLKNVEVSSLDWRTFLRKTTHSINLFCARASLRPDELVRALTDDKCPYNTATVVYWASKNWQLGAKEEKFFAGEHSYDVQDKQRRLIFFKRV